MTTHNFMIQVDAAERAMWDYKTWQSHFKNVCEEHGLKVTSIGDRLGISNPTGEPLDVGPLCTEATWRTLKPTPMSEKLRSSLGDHTAPLTREEYDKEVDRKEDLRDLDARERALSAYLGHLKTMAEEALRLAKAERHVTFMMAWASVIVSIEKDLI